MAKSQTVIVGTITIDERFYRSRVDYACSTLGRLQRHTQKLCAQIILNAWREGTGHRIKLADCAIVAIERKQRSNENFLRVL